MQPMGKTFAEKLLGARCGRPVRAGERVLIETDFIITHDDSAEIARSLRASGQLRLWDPARIVIALDHCVPAGSERIARDHQEVRALVEEHRIPAFFDVQRGVCHQVAAEEGFALPGRVLVASDPHATMHGALGALASAVTAAEAAGIWTSGRVELEVPLTLRVEVTGELPAGVGAKDVMLHLLRTHPLAPGRCRALELCGPAVRQMSMGGRMTLCNMAAVSGARFAYVEPDGVTLRYLGKRARLGFEPVFSDPDAGFEGVVSIDASTLVPLVACPHDDGEADLHRGASAGGETHHVVPVSEVAGRRIHQAVLGTCAGGRVEDLWAVATRLRGKRVHPGVRLLVFPASREVYTEALRLGLLADLSEAGAMIMNPGCGPCLGRHQGLLAPGEVCVSTGNNNDRGGMGSGEAEVYLASPETVAASALAGSLADPRG